LEQTRTNRDKVPEIKIRENIEEKLEHLDKQEKYLIGQDKDKTECGLMMRKPRQEMRILTQSQF